MAALRALARIAWRDARRSPARSALVVALVAVPVAGLVGGTAVFRTADQTPAERITNTMGAADLQVAAFPGEPVSTADVAAVLPAGSRVEPADSEPAGVAVAGGVLPVTLRAVDLRGLATGTLDLTAGRAPAAPGEVAASAAVLAPAGVGLGDELRVDGAAATVVGEVRDPEALSAALVLAPPDALPAPAAWLVDLPPGTDVGAAAARVEADGTLLAVTRAEAAVRGAAETTALFVLGALALLEAALVAATAFAVSIRRRQRELGLLAAAGAHPAHLRGAVLLSGVGLGAVGGVIGLVVGLAGALALLPRLEGWADRVVGGLDTDPVTVLAAAGMGVLAATVAAWVPARSAARLPVAVALSGLRPPSAPARRSLALGLVLVVLGFLLVLAAVPLQRELVDATDVVAAVLALGAAVTVLGFGLTSPWLLAQAGRWAPRLPVGPRLAVRDVARFRARNGPVVTALLAGLALSVAVGASVATVDAADAAAYDPRLRDDQLLVQGPAAARVAAELADRFDAAAAAVGAPVGVHGVGLHGASEPLIAPVAAAVGDAELVRVLGGDGAAVAAHADGHVVLLGRSFAGVDRVDVGGGGGGGAAWLPVHVVARPDLAYDPDVPNAVVPVAVAPVEDAGTERPRSPTGLLRLPGPVTDAQARAAQAAAAAAPVTTVAVERGPQADRAGFGRVVLALAVASTLVVVAVALALSAAETRADERTLLAIGAAPGIRRSIAAGRAAVLAGLAGLLAVPAGLLPAWGVIRTATDMAFVVPWPTLAVAAVLTPAVAVAGAWVAARPAPAWAAPRA